MRGRFTIIVYLLMQAFATAVSAQAGDDETAIQQVIEKLFLGMHKGDSTMVQDTFAPHVTLATIYRNKAETVIHHESGVSDFLKAVGTPHQDVWSEEYWNLKILIDGDFASAWCNYAFYLNNNFSHCGVDAFHFVRTKTGWKIFHLADTRRKDKCVIPPEVQQKHQ
jgi:hypothetical protein